MSGGGWMAYMILVSAPVPLGLIGSLNLLGLGWGWVQGPGGLGPKGLGTGLDNKSMIIL